MTILCFIGYFFASLNLCNLRGLVRGLKTGDGVKEMLLSDRTIKSLQPASKAKKYADGEGLFLFVNSNGTKSWRFRYRNVAGIEKELTFGVYPEISLLEARTKKIEVRKLIRAGKDPIADKKEKKLIAVYAAGNTFQGVATEWFNLNKDKWTNKYSLKIWSRLEKYVFPKIGDKAISQVTGLEILETIIRKLEKEGKTESSHKLLQNCSAILQLAFLTKRVPYNPLIGLRGVLKPHKTKGFPTIKIDELPDFLHRLEQHETSYLYKLAIEMLLLTFVRQGELRKAKWEYFNFEKKLWCIPAEMMKTRQEHIVPLSKQSLKVLKLIKDITGDSAYLFPTKNKIKHPYMNENVINNIIRSLGYKDKLVGHGFRSLASTTLNELGYSSDVIEKQLAHSERNKSRAAYNRAKYLPQRIEMMQFWADYIDTIIYK